MNKFLKEIGSFVLSLILISIPILTTLSFVFHWYQIVQVLCVAGTVGELVTLSVVLNGWDEL
jgi:hypothetical protein